MNFFGVNKNSLSFVWNDPRINTHECFHDKITSKNLLINQNHHQELRSSFSLLIHLIANRNLS